MKSNLWIVIKKELKRVFDDRRLVFTTFILPAISIALIYSIMGNMIGKMNNDIEEHIPSVYVQNAPASFTSLLNEDMFSDKMTLTIVPGDDSLEGIKQNIQNGVADLLVVFEDNFEQNVSNYKVEKQVPEIKTFYNSSEEYSRTARYNLFGSVFGTYENRIVGDRLGNMKYVNAFDVDRNREESVIVDEQKATGKGLGTLLPMLITIFLFAGGMGIGMDIIAGEKERGTMATLLVTPVKRETIALGKIIGLSIVSFLSAISSFIGVLVSLPFSSVMFGGAKGGINLAALNFSGSQYLQLVLLMLTMVGVFVGLISLTSIISKNVKEAGTYIVPVYMLVMVASFMNMFSTGTAVMSQYAVPIYGSVVAIKSLLSFELTWLAFGVVCAVNIVFTAVLVWAIRKMFNSEKIMFGV
ncbi:ABC transporter permease [Clostridium sp. 'deep sea']|uniref:ABC transporter permease n=1 Tax=Clostridium sp. 'deep sea' TaxID=2779445 RepID=UPI0018964120|nr:ABC transporter permease subunit [Clostridium sp. 'deep sea']QOR35433.1 ABC transporter permease [Clostridium sp. 'deep sea']